MCTASAAARRAGTCWSSSSQATPGSTSCVSRSSLLSLPSKTSWLALQGRSLRNSVTKLVLTHVHQHRDPIFLFASKVWFFSSKLGPFPLNLQYNIYNHLGAVQTSCKWVRMPLVKRGDGFASPWSLVRSNVIVRRGVRPTTTAALLNSFGSADVVCSCFHAGGQMKHRCWANAMWLSVQKQSNGVNRFAFFWQVTFFSCQKKKCHGLVPLLKLIRDQSSKGIFCTKC